MDSLVQRLGALLLGETPSREAYLLAVIAERRDEVKERMISYSESPDVEDRRLGTNAHIRCLQG